MQAEPPNAAQPKSRRRWHQFGLRTLLMGIVLLSLPLGWLGLKVREGCQRQAVVAAITKLGGFVLYDYEFDFLGDFVPQSAQPAPAWLRAVLGDDFFRDAFGVYFSSSSVKDADLVLLSGFAKLNRLQLIETQISDAGLQHLKGLTRLTKLSLDRTHVTDAGLENLMGLTHLEELYLTGTQVTDAGVATLQKALPNCRIYH